MASKVAPVYMCILLLVLVSVSEAQTCPGALSYVVCQTFLKNGTAPSAKSPCCSFIKDKKKVSDKCLCDTALKGKLSFAGVTVSIDFNTVAKWPKACGRPSSGYICKGKKF